MTYSLSLKLSLFCAFFLALVVAVVGATFVVLQRQADDGVVVNLAGRQRMLSQRLTHQLLGYSTMKDRGRDIQIQRGAVLGTMMVFEKTLVALDHGGPAPLDLEMVNTRTLPVASTAVSDQLTRVLRTYENYRRYARDILEGSDEQRAVAVNYIIDHNTELLSEMNTAVFLAQNEAEERVRQLYYIQASALLAGVLVFLLLLSQVRHTVVEPLKRLSLASDMISRGEVNRPVDVSGPEELAALGASVERLRLAMKHLLPRGPVSTDFAEL